MTLRQVLVGVVTDTGTVDALFCLALVESTRMCLANNIILTPVFMRSNGNASMRYNQLFTLAWKDNADSLLFVSPENFWSPQTLLDAVLSAKDVLAVPVFGVGGFEVHLGEIPRIQTDDVTGEIKVLGASLGFLRLSQDVVTKLCETHPTIEFDGAEVKLVLQHGDIYGAFATDAEVLAYRLKEAGFEMWMNPNHTINTNVRQPTNADFAAALYEAKNGGV